MKNYIDISKNLAQFIKLKRNELNITQEKLAEISLIDYKHIQNLESMKRVNDPRLSTLLKLSEALKINIDELLKNIVEF